MSTERVVLNGSAPVGVDHHRTVLLWTDSVHPVIFVGEASARPAHYRNLELLESLNEVLSVTVDVWNIRIRTNPDTVIDASSEMLCKLSVDFCRNDRLVFSLFMDSYLNLCARSDRHDNSQKEQTDSFHFFFV